MLKLGSWRAALVLALTFVALAVPGSAFALAPPAPMPDPCRITDSYAYGCDTQVSTLATYKGWGHVTVGLYCGGANPGQEYLDQLARPRTAYRWTVAGWATSSVATGTQVYIWPYAVGWSWVWTQGTGWLAMRDDDLVINPRFQCYWPYGPPPAAAR